MVDSVKQGRAWKGIMITVSAVLLGVVFEFKYAIKQILLAYI